MPDYLDEQTHPGVREWAREAFVGNECDTDEYGETQPAKGIGYILEWTERAGDPKDPEMWADVRAWLDAMAGGGRYAGADELMPVLVRCFDLLWSAGEHPYYDNTDEGREGLLEQWREETAP